MIAPEAETRASAPACRCGRPSPSAGRRLHAAASLVMATSSTPCSSSRRLQPEPAGGRVCQPAASRDTTRGGPGRHIRSLRPGLVAGVNGRGKFVAWAAAVTSEPGQVCTVPAAGKQFLQPLDVSPSGLPDAAPARPLTCAHWRPGDACPGAAASSSASKESTLGLGPRHR
jgi:hypothetical protein